MSGIPGPNRYNNASGAARSAPDSKLTGTALVARVMAHKGGHQGTANGHGVKFTMEEGNRAKRIDHDAAPK